MRRNTSTLSNSANIHLITIPMRRNTSTLSNSANIYAHD